MKTLAVALVLAGCLVWVPLAGARDTNREVINREWLLANPQQITVKANPPRFVHSQQTQAYLGVLPKNYVAKRVR